MRKPLSLTLAFVFLAQTIFLPALAQDDTNATTMRNEDVLGMVRAKVPAEVIVAKIKSSRCNFDTFPSVLTELKHKGVPDSVMLAMVQAPVGRAQAPPPVAKVAAPETSAAGLTLREITIPADTAVDIEAAYAVSSEDVSEGSRIGLVVIEPVKIKGVTVIERNARVTAIVTKSQGGRSWGRGGQLAWEMKDVTAVDGSRLPLQFTKGQKTGDGKIGSMTTGMIVTSIFLLPAAPLWGFKRGKAAVLQPGKHFQVFTRADAVIKVAAPAAQ